MQSNDNNMSSGRTQPESESGKMPSLGMDSPNFPGEMPSGDINASNSQKMQNVLVEMRVPKNQGVLGASQMAAQINVTGFQLDTSYEPVPVSASGDAARFLADNQEIAIVRGVVEESKIEELEAQPNVIKVYKDTPIAPFESALLEKADKDLVMPMDAIGTCPIGTCDCSPTTPKGAIADVATYFGVDKIWAAGYKGQGIVVGVVDGGITAEGRYIGAFETNRTIPNVIGGPAQNWGTILAYQHLRL